MPGLDDGTNRGILVAGAPMGGGLIPGATGGRGGAGSKLG